MESNIKGLVSAGHEMASELKAECGAVDMRSVAKLISDLATGGGECGAEVWRYGRNQGYQPWRAGILRKRWSAS